ncbi:LysM peptidoglycan-binding domain-containing protein [Tuberibacillus sp. Marseille-P3662]|uniref:LysM peptidoglycan-binding domain-containing protein n=1 Tax=Tuberibacillus sp. Marseille-P3662 TaxID=1965358 RepID=UPI001592FD93|nr:LysM domain-containing protein [Tuberibacillus sp. Marseille-P3662]
MKIYVVQKGDTMYEIAQKHGIALETVKKANPQIKNPDNLQPGMKLKIPSTSKAVKKEKPKKEQPKKEQPKKEQPKKEQPKKEQPKKEQPKKEQPKKEQPKKEQPKKEQPKKEQPKKEQPKKEQPKKEQPKKEQPKKEQPKKEETGKKENMKPMPEEPIKTEKPAPKTNKQPGNKSNNDQKVTINQQAAKPEMKEVSLNQWLDEADNQGFSGKDIQPKGSNDAEPSKETPIKTQSYNHKPSKTKAPSFPLSDEEWNINPYDLDMSNQDIPMLESDYYPNMINPKSSASNETSVNGGQGGTAIWGASDSSYGYQPHMQQGFNQPQMPETPMSQQWMEPTAKGMNPQQFMPYQVPGPETQPMFFNDSMYQQQMMPNYQHSMPEYQQPVMPDYLNYQQPMPEYQQPIMPNYQNYQQSMPMYQQPVMPDYQNYQQSMPGYHPQMMPYGMDPYYQDCGCGAPPSPHMMPVYQDPGYWGMDQNGLNIRWDAYANYENHPYQPNFPKASNDEEDV